MSFIPATPSWLPMSPDLALVPNHIHLFLATTEISDDSIAHLDSFLSSEERERFARFRMPQKRNEAIVSRALLRERLSGFLDIPPAQIALAVNPHGKPHIEGAPVYFNVSHTAGCVLLAVSGEHELGVDIESPREHLSHEDLAKRYFTAAEHAALLEYPQDQRTIAFFRCWTRKEALLKAIGRGISGGLDTFEVPLGELSSPLTLDGWTLHDLAVPSPHIAALATRQTRPLLHFWRWHPPR
ncbi:MAG TPA: 4'-phosphopantetheinyl transferase superfamily protein [Phycisphaerae bacterium]|nr:4'-phosphopantetheinyl transferase superfamily protein [Phycisphaerae bacterium]